MRSAPRSPTGRAPGSGLRVPVGELLARAVAVRDWERETVVEGLEVQSSAVEGPLHLRLRLEHVVDGIMASGRLGAHWRAACSRCLGPVSGVLDLEVREMFERHPVESETYLIAGDEIDLEPIVRDAVVPHLPMVPLCADDCLGLCPTCGANRNVERCECPADNGDPRWAALDDLSFN